MIADLEVVGWDFSADLREDFYYETYLLSTRQEVWVKMIPSGLPPEGCPDT